MTKIEAQLLQTEARIRNGETDLLEHYTDLIILKSEEIKDQLEIGLHPAQVTEDEIQILLAQNVILLHPGSAQKSGPRGLKK